MFEAFPVHLVTFRLPYDEHLSVSTCDSDDSLVMLFRSAGVFDSVEIVQSLDPCPEGGARVTDLNSDSDIRLQKSVKVQVILYHFIIKLSATYIKQIRR